MSTRCRYYYQDAEGMYHSVYRHYDGYPSVAGYEFCYGILKYGSAEKFVKEYALENNQSPELAVFGDINAVQNHFVNSDLEWGYLIDNDGTYHVYHGSWDANSNRYYYDATEKKTIIELIEEHGGTNPESDFLRDKAAMQHHVETWNMERNHVLDLLSTIKYDEDDWLYENRITNIINEFYDKRIAAGPDPTDE